MTDSINFSHLSSEIFLLIALCVIMIVDLFQRDRERKLTFALTQLSLMVLLVLGVNDLTAINAESANAAGTNGNSRIILFSGHWVVDQLAIILKLGIYITTSLALFYARPFINCRNLMRGEYYLLTLFSVLGMMIMVSGNSLLMIYLGLELMSLSLYALVALQRDSKVASEAAVKYFVMGGLASGFLLYGISLVYGASQSIIITDIAQFYSSEKVNLISQFGLVFLVIGMAFKFGAVPFHMWLPDIYHGSPSSITAYISSVPKIAAFGMMVRVLFEAFADASNEWSSMILIVALLSVGFGNVIAVSQNNLKRLLAYSAIAHIGYFLLGVVPGDSASYSAAMYYILVYSIMTLAGFGMVIFMSTEEREYQQISDLKGLGRYHPWYALLFTIVMVSMAGIPPFIGFWPKLEIFRNLVINGFVLEAVIAIAFSVVGLFYYLRVIKEMFFSDADEAPEITNSRALKIAVTFNCLLLFVLGLMPDSLYQYCLDALNRLA